MDAPLKWKAAFVRRPYAGAHLSFKPAPSAAVAPPDTSPALHVGTTAVAKSSKSTASKVSQSPILFYKEPS